MNSGRPLTPPFSGEHKRADLHADVDRANTDVAVRRQPRERDPVGLDLPDYRFPIPEQHCDTDRRTAHVLLVRGGRAANQRRVARNAKAAGV